MALTRDSSGSQTQIYSASFFPPPSASAEGKEEPQTHYDFLLSFPQLLQLAESGNVSAQAMAGCSLLYGWKGCVINQEQGAQWIAKAKTRLDTAAGIFAQGICYDDAICGVGIKDINKAAEYFTQASKQSYIPARTRLANFIANGYAGIQRDINEAVQMLTECATLGYVPALPNLGDLYYEGKGVPKDYKEMEKLYRKAAEDGQATGRCDLGWCYENGYGVERDIHKARYWYKLAAKQGSGRGKKSLARAENIPAPPSCCTIL
jgi:TPR repeat protein